MRIAFLAHYPVSSLPGIRISRDSASEHQAGWISSLVRCLLQYLGCELHIVTYSALVDEDQTISSGNATYHVLRLPRMRSRLFTWFSLDRDLFRTKLVGINPDIVHGHGTESVYGYAALESGFPSIITIQGILSKIAMIHPGKGVSDFLANRAMVSIENRTIRRGRFFVANTPFAADYIRGMNFRATTFMIDNPVDRIYSNSAIRNPTNAQTIVFVGTISRLKGTEELLRAFSRVAGLFKGIELKLIGYGEPDYLRRRIFPLIQELQLGGIVTLCGKRSPSEIVDELSKAICLVLPSWIEQAPQVIAEAMSVGVPVVASSVGGVPYMVEDGVSGLLCRPGSVESLAERLAVLVHNTELQVRMGAKAREVALLRHDDRSIAGKLAIAYESVLGTSV